MENEVDSGAPSPEKDQGGKSVSDLVVTIFDQLGQLSSLIDQSPAIGDQEKQEFGALMKGYQAFVEKLSQSPEQESQMASKPVGVESGGNRNARPMMM